MMHRRASASRSLRGNRSNSTCAARVAMPGKWQGPFFLDEPDASIGEAELVTAGMSGPELVVAHTGELDGPNSKPAHADQFWARHPGGAQFCFADGSVRFVKERRPINIFQALATRAGAEVLSNDSY